MFDVPELPAPYGVRRAQHQGDHSPGASEAALGDRAVVDPLGGVALLVSAAPVLGEPRVDQSREGLEQGRLGALPTTGGLSERSRPSGTSSPWARRARCPGIRR